jgi:hypothetical protein
VIAVVMYSLVFVSISACPFLPCRAAWRSGARLSTGTGFCQYYGRRYFQVPSGISFCLCCSTVLCIALVVAVISSSLGGLLFCKDHLCRLFIRSQWLVLPVFLSHSLANPSKRGPCTVASDIRLFSSGYPSDESYVTLSQLVSPEDSGSRCITVHPEKAAYSLTTTPSTVSSVLLCLQVVSDSMRSPTRCATWVRPINRAR